MRFFVLLLLAFVVAAPISAEEFAFDEAEIEKKIWHLGGYGELRPGLNLVDRDAALSRLRYYNRAVDQALPDFNAKLLLEGSIEKDWAKLFVQPSLDYTNTRLLNDLQLTWYEAWLQAKPNDSFKAQVGKRSLRWGKGYAWNPVAFFDRPKNPDDPELSQEGYWLATADYIQSFDGPLQTLAITPVLLPQRRDLNDDFGSSDRLNWGGKLYLLLYDTDIDLLMMGRGSRSASYGLDVSRNLTTNFELHGELAWVVDAPQQVLLPSGQAVLKRSNATSWLLGLRYLTEQDTTYILEYYRNGNGYSQDQLQSFYNAVDTGYAQWQQTGNASQLQRLGQLQSYSRIAPMTDYLYARVSQKEPADILYLTPALTAIANLRDGSLSLAPELLYTGFTNLELRLKGTVTMGANQTEFAEKQNDARFELRLRYYF